jgi:hypothetical protein
LAVAVVEHVGGVEVFDAEAFLQLADPVVDCAADSLGIELRRLVRGLPVSVGRDSFRSVSPRREVLSWTLLVYGSKGVIKVAGLTVMRW